MMIRKAGSTYSVHRVVAATFLGQPASMDLQVNHKDLDRGNNHIQNLEYVTQSQNSKHAHSMRGDAALTGRIGRAVQVRPSAGTSAWLDFDTIKAASVYTGLQAHHISRICRGLCPGVGSWEVRFASEEQFPDELWRPILPEILEGSRAPAQVQRLASEGLCERI